MIGKGTHRAWLSEAYQSAVLVNAFNRGVKAVDVERVVKHSLKITVGYAHRALAENEMRAVVVGGVKRTAPRLYREFVYGYVLAILTYNSHSVARVDSDVFKLYIA